MFVCKLVIVVVNTKEIYTNTSDLVWPSLSTTDFHQKLTLKRVGGN